MINGGQRQRRLARPAQRAPQPWLPCIGKRVDFHQAVFETWQGESRTKLRLVIGPQLGALNSPNDRFFFHKIPGGARAKWFQPLRVSPRAATRAQDRAAGLANKRSPPHAPAMFVVTEADAAAIRAVYEQRGEFAAAVELRRRFPGITDNAQARECARTIAGWKPLPLRPVKPAPRLRRVR